MNGATALDCENTINRPNSTNTMTIGTSQYFFSCFRNCTNSDNTRPLLMCDLLLLLPARRPALGCQLEDRLDEILRQPGVAPRGQVHVVERQMRIRQIH